MIPIINEIVIILTYNYSQIDITLNYIAQIISLVPLILSCQLLKQCSNMHNLFWIPFTVYLIVFQVLIPLIHIFCDSF